MSAISISTPGSPKPVVCPKPIGGGVSLGEMETQQLNAGGHARCLEELQFRGDAVDAHWCEACRLPSVACICEAGVRRTSTIRITHAKMVQLVIVARCASFVNIDFFKYCYTQPPAQRSGIFPSSSVGPGRSSGLPSPLMAPVISSTWSSFSRPSCHGL